MCRLSPFFYYPMIIGIISDTHDDMFAIKKAVDVFNDKNVSHVLHAGDLISPFTFEIFSELHCGLTAIFGNNDGDKVLLKQRSGGNIHQQPLALTFDGKKFILLHEPDLVDALSYSGRFQVVIYGHTHTPDVRKVGDTLVVNPGKAARLHKGDSTLGLLNTDEMTAEIMRL